LQKWHQKFQKYRPMVGIPTSLAALRRRRGEEERRRGGEEGRRGGGEEERRLACSPGAGPSLACSTGAWPVSQTSTVASALATASRGDIRQCAMLVTACGSARANLTLCARKLGMPPPNLQNGGGEKSGEKVIRT